MSLAPAIVYEFEPSFRLKRKVLNFLVPVYVDLQLDYLDMLQNLLLECVDWTTTVANKSTDALIRLTNDAIN